MTTSVFHDRLGERILRREVYLFLGKSDVTAANNLAQLGLNEADMNKSSSIMIH